MFGLIKKNDDRNCGKNLIHFLSKNAQLTRDKIKILFGLAENVHKNEKKSYLIIFMPLKVDCAAWKTY